MGCVVVRDGAVAAIGSNKTNAERNVTRGRQCWGRRAVACWIAGGHMLCCVLLMHASAPLLPRKQLMPRCRLCADVCVSGHVPVSPAGHAARRVCGNRQAAGRGGGRPCWRTLYRVSEGLPRCRSDGVRRMPAPANVLHAKHRLPCSLSASMPPACSRCRPPPLNAPPHPSPPPPPPRSCHLYVTCEPCIMCAAALSLLRFRSVTLRLPKRQVWGQRVHPQRA